MRIYSATMHAVLLLPIAVLLCKGQEIAPKNELGFTLGGIPSLSRSTSQQSLDLGPGTAFRVNYGRRFVSGDKVALYGEVNFLASPCATFHRISAQPQKTSPACTSRPGFG
jgi:hypothetical protein